MAHNSGRESDFNRNDHPERRWDEVWVTNSDIESVDCVGWGTRRIGNVAYDNKGIPLGSRWPGSFPVFASQAEIAREGLSILRGLVPVHTGFVCPKRSLAHFDPRRSSVIQLADRRYGVLDATIEALLFTDGEESVCVAWLDNQRERYVGGPLYPQRGQSKEYRRMLSGAYGKPHRVPLYSNDENPVPIGWEWKVAPQIFTPRKRIVTTDEICDAPRKGDIPVSFERALANPGVYRFMPQPVSAALLVLEDGRPFYVNDGIVLPYKRGFVREAYGCWNTSMPIPQGVEGFSF